MSNEYLYGAVRSAPDDPLLTQHHDTPLVLLPSRQNAMALVRRMHARVGYGALFYVRAQEDRFMHSHRALALFNASSGLPPEPRFSSGMLLVQTREYANGAVSRMLAALREERDFVGVQYTEADPDFEPRRSRAFILTRVDDSVLPLSREHLRNLA